MSSCWHVHRDAARFPNAKGEQWDRSRFGEQVWKKSVEAAAKCDRKPSVFEGFTFHMLRHTAGSLMALAGLDPAVASKRMGHTDGGALFLRTYRHLTKVKNVPRQRASKRWCEQAWTRKGHQRRPGS